ncbi:MAG: 2OG-Fe(II) oxygenase family protein [Hyphomicrobiales bacterium]
MATRLQDLLGKGDRYALAGDPERARKAYRQAVKQAPADALALSRLIDLEMRTGNQKAAVPLLRKLTSVRSGEPAIRLKLAAALEDSGDAAEAEKELRNLVAETPGLAEAHNNLGNLLIVKQAYEEALSAYDAALALNPGVAASWINAGNVLDELGRPADALERYAKAIEIQPSLAEAHYFRARARTALGEEAAALADVEECLRRDPADQKGLALKGVLLTALGREDEARALFDYDRFMRPMTVEPPQGYASLVEFNAAVIDHIRKRVKLEYNPYGVSTRGGYHSRNLLRDPHPTMQALRAMLQTVFSEYVAGLPQDDAHPFLRRKHSRVRLVAQAQLLESQGYLSSHIHPGGWVSSAYYLQVPEVVSDDADRPGWLEFGRPTEEIKTSTGLELRAIRPEPGRAVLFPSYFFHGTRPFESSEPRISLGVDLIAQD